MANGFEHFDGGHHENFLAALLLLAMDSDEKARVGLVGLIRQKSGEGDLGEMLDFGREAGLSRNEDDERQRSDIWLSFQRGTVLVEVKSHLRWIPERVLSQLTSYAASGIVPRTGTEVVAVVLLAPRDLAAVWPKASLLWSEVLTCLRGLESHNPVTALVLRHLEGNVERPMGFQSGPMADIAAAARTTAALREFLQSCARAIDGEFGAHDLYLTAGDGEPRRWNLWAWYGLSIPFRRNGEPLRVGVYRYTEAPPDRQEDLKTAWLEAYYERVDAYEPIIALPFKDGDLSPANLELTRQAFQREWSKHQR